MHRSLRHTAAFCPLIMAVYLLMTAPILAQQTSSLGPLEPSNTSSPAATLTSLIDSCNELHEFLKDGPITEEREAKVLPTAERILDCLDLRDLPKDLRLSAGMESALFLKEILDRIPLPDVAAIPDPTQTEEGAEPLEQWVIPGTRLAIELSKEGPRRGAWVFNADTVRNASQFYRIVNELPYRAEGPRVSEGLHDTFIEATKKRPTLTADTSSPRGTLTMFLDACNELNEQVTSEETLDRNDPRFQELGLRIVSCLDTSQLPEFAREYFDAEAAVCLKEVLDRTALPPLEQVPGIESVESSDGGEALTRWQIPRTQIVIAKIAEGPRRGEFLFSSETVKRAPEFYRKAVKQPYRQDGRPVSAGFYEWWLSRPSDGVVASIVDALPASFQNRVLGMAIWQWIGLGLLVPLAIFLFFVLWKMGRRPMAEEVRTESRGLIRHWFGLVFPVLAMLIPLAFKYVIWEYMTLRGRPLYIANFCADLVFLLAVVILIVRSSSRIAETIVALPHISPRGLDANLIRIVCRVLGIVAAVIVFLEGGRYLGFPLTTLIASAGIGGLAIALSAQGLIKGLFGTVTILLDRPYRVGDRIIAKGHEGKVTEIGLRSTKIRAMDGRTISIPNDLMAESEIQKFKRDGSIRRKANIQIPLDTPRDTVEKALICIREILQDHEGMDPKLPPEVYFLDFDPASFNICFMYWFSPIDIKKFREFGEKVNLEIMRVFEEQGIQFSLPFRHTFWKTDDEQGPLDVVVKNEN